MAKTGNIQVIYGSRVSPFTGPAEAKRGRVTIFQDIIPELEEIGPDDVRMKDVNCRIFGPKEILEKWREILRFPYDADSIEPCLVYPGDTAQLVPLLEAKIPNLEFLNSDDDEVFARELK